MEPRRYIPICMKKFLMLGFCMRSTCTLSCCLIFCGLLGHSALAQQPDVNQTEAKVPAYVLPDPLVMSDGKKVTHVEQWSKSQRPYIYHLFETNVYGRFPRSTLPLHFKITDTDTRALDGAATRKQITLYLSPTDTTAQLHLLLYLPNRARRKVPVFLGMNFYGNQSVSPDPAVPVTPLYTVSGPTIVNHRASAATHGAQASQWPVKEIIAKGYGLATFFCGDAEEDHADGWKTGLRTKLKDALHIQPEEWGAIGVWAWALCRALDYLQKDPAVNGQQVALLGHSRLGKAALWAGASDTRFAIVISNESGEGGAALSRRWYGETVEIITRNFPHWFIPAYRSYSSRTDVLPVDQHMLLSLIAPRPLYIASAEGDQWSDPKGEFLSAVHAGPVYRLYGRQGIATDSMPSLQQPVGEVVRYHIRTGKHDVTDYDWQQYLLFADRHFRHRP